jgi:DNA-binding CsgD family transcriptional regulator
MTSQSQPHGRLLERLEVSAEAEELWRVLIEAPLASAEEIGQQTRLAPAALEGAINALVSAQLVQRSAGPLGVTAVDPALAIESHLRRAERRLSEDLQHLATLRAAIPLLSTAYAHGRPATDEPSGIEVIVALDDVRRQIYLASEGARHETRSLLHSMTAPGLRDAGQSDLEMASRGIRRRSIVGSADLSDPDVFAELQTLQSRGESFRALPEVPTRLQIYDRQLAVLLVDSTKLHRGAIFVRIQSLIDLLISLFDHLWSIADPIFGAGSGSDAPAGRQARTLELMAIGTKDERIARTLGVGTRTIRRDISDLKATLGVSSRAEIIAAAIRKGWL